MAHGVFDGVFQIEVGGFAAGRGKGADIEVFHLKIGTVDDVEILFLISGYGGESSKKYELHIDRYDQSCRIISDDSSSIRKFCRNNHFRSTPLTEDYHKARDGRHISDVIPCIPTSRN